MKVLLLSILFVSGITYTQDTPPAGQQSAEISAKDNDHRLRAAALGLHDEYITAYAFGHVARLVAARLKQRIARIAQQMNAFPPTRPTDPI